MAHNMYPLNLNLSGKLCTVVGGGQIAHRKTLGLLDCGPLIKVVSPEVCPELMELQRRWQVELYRREFRSSDVDGSLLVIAASGDPRVNKEAADVCRYKSILVNVVDDPENSDFFVPSVLRRGFLTLAVSTCGRSPSLSAVVKRQLEKTYGPEYAAVTDVLGEIREELMSAEFSEEERKDILLRLAEKELPEIIEEIKRWPRG